MRQKLKIGTPLMVEVTWYDKCVVPPLDRKYQGEVIGWRDSQIIISVKDYAVLRFWKRNGLEVGNRDYDRRGFRVDVAAITESILPEGPGVEVTFSEDDNG